MVNLTFFVGISITFLGVSSYRMCYHTDGLASQFSRTFWSFPVDFCASHKEIKKSPSPGIRLSLWKYSPHTSAAALTCQVRTPAEFGTKRHQFPVPKLCKSPDPGELRVSFYGSRVDEILTEPGKNLTCDMNRTRRIYLYGDHWRI